MQIPYTYYVSVQGEEPTQHRSGRLVSEYINEQIGFQVVSRDMVTNYFTRPHIKVNEAVFGRIKLCRVATKTLPELASQPH